MIQSRFFKASLLSLVVFLSSCGSSVDPLATPLTREYSTVTGEFKSLGSIHVNDTVTHLFEQDDGTILYAYSDRYDLNESLKARVEAYGVVTTYDSLEKALFEVKRISEPTEAEAGAAVTDTPYKNAALGISFTYPSSWTMKTEDGTRTLLEAPMPVAETDTPVTSTGTDVAPSADTAEFLKLSAGLTSTSDTEQDARASEIRDYVTAQFPDLAGVTGDLTYVGTDRVIGLRYKTATGDVSIFAPRGSDLFELSFHTLSQDDGARIENTNTFTSIVASFRFIPEGGETADSGEAVTDVPVEAPEETVTSDDVSAPSGEQVEVSKWGSLSSNAYAFSMNYPAAWYYMGGSTGYLFNDAEISDTATQGLIQLSFNTGAAEGTVRSGNTVSITRKVESRSYTLSGSSEYESIMQSMSDSIKTTKGE